MQASFIWANSEDAGRNAYCLFRRQFTLTASPIAAELHIFADCRYRLHVNGQWVANGPIRCQTLFPEYDSIDLLPWLHAGANEMLLEVNTHNSPSYQCAIDSRAGCVAWGEVACDGETLDLVTPGEWQAKISRAQHPLAQNFSFTQGPVEELNCALLAREMRESTGWSTPVGVTEGPWGELSPRSIGAAENSLQCPASIEAYALLDDEEVIGARVFMSYKSGARRGLRFACASWIHSPREQGVELGMLWGPFFCNGVELTSAYDDIRGKGARQNAMAYLRAGWNLLYGELEYFPEVWGVMIGLPRWAGLTARAEPHFDCLHTLRCGPVMTLKALTATRPAPPVDAQSLALVDIDWQLVPIGAPAPFPARCISWDTIERELPVAVQGDIVTLPADRPSCLIGDFAPAFSGWLSLTIDAPPGTIVDAAACDRLRKDGLVNSCHRPFIEGADRYLVSGMTRIEGFHVRGGRYWQLSIRPPVGSSGEIVVRDFAVRSAVYDLPISGQFTCSDPLFNWVWQTSADTLRVSLEDAFIVDCYRERGVYIADSFAMSLGLRALSRDTRVEFRTMRLFDQARKAYGNMPGTTPTTNPPGGIGTFPVMWVLWLRNRWAWSGDLDLLREMLPSVEDVLRKIAVDTAPSGLSMETGFVDWGEDLAARDCKENGAFNALRYGALRAAAEMAQAIGDTQLAGAWRTEAAVTRAAMTDRLWDAERGCFAAGIADGIQSPADPLHANILALYSDCFAPAQRDPLLAWVRARLLPNHYRCLADESGRVELHFLQYVLDALYRHGDALTAEQVIRAHYSILYGRKFPTLLETVGRGETDSWCHAWGCHPLWWFQTRVLGVQLVQHGDPTRLLIAPESYGLQHAAGVFPHPMGDIQIAWRIDGRKLLLDVQAPTGVSIEAVRPAGALAKLELLLTGIGSVKSEG